MNKIWFSNYLSIVGKWGGFSFLFGTAIIVFFFGGSFSSRAYVSDTSTNSYQQTEFKLDFNPISKINEITAPVNNLINSAVNGLKLNHNINIGTGIPLSPIKSPSQNIGFSKFFSSSRVSSGNIINFLKEATIAGINLTILVISITTQVLKGLLSVIK